MARLIFALSLILLLAGCVSRGLERDGPSVDAPVLREGTAWTYQVRNGFNGIDVAQYRYRVNRVTAERTVVEVLRKDLVPPSRFGYGVVVTGDGRPVADMPQGPVLLPPQLMAGGWTLEAGTTLAGWPLSFSPPLRILPFPMATGATWYQVVTASDPPPAWPRRVEVWGEVLGWESVRVPAGEFRALKVRRSSNLGDDQVWRGQTHMVEYDWYAPEIGLVVKHQEQGNFFVRGGPDAYWQEVDRFVAELVEYIPAR